MSDRSIIHYEQGAKLSQLSDRAEKYKEALQEVIMVFAKNTILQLFCMDLNLRAFDLHKAFSDKDYSQFLFDETDAYLKEVSEGDKIKEILESTPRWREIARQLTASMVLMDEAQKKLNEQETEKGTQAEP